MNIRAWTWSSSRATVKVTGSTSVDGKQGLWVVWRVTVAAFVAERRERVVRMVDAAKVFILAGMGGEWM
jgi:hypothetical protein